MSDMTRLLQLLELQAFVEGENYGHWTAGLVDRDLLAAAIKEAAKAVQFNLSHEVR